MHLVPSRGRTRIQAARCHIVGTRRQLAMARERNETAPVSGVKQPKRVKLKRRKAKYGVMKIEGSAKAARPNKSGMIIGKVEERAASGGVIGLWHVRTRDATGKPITREVPVRKFKALPSSGIIKWMPYGEV